MEILNQFGINPLLLAAQIVNFLILLFILKKFLYGPILKILDIRKKTIEKSLKNAEEIERKLQATDEQSEKIIAKTLQESQKILDDTKIAAAQILGDAQKTAVEIIDKANVQALEVVKSQKVILEQEMKKHVGDLVVLAFEKITGKKVTADDQRKLIEKEVKNLS